MLFEAANLVAVGAHAYPVGTADAAADALRTLAARGVLAVIGPAISDNALACMPVADELQLPCINWSGSEATRSDWMFQYQVGSLEVGKQADIVRLAGDRPGLANVHDSYQQLVYSAGPADVADVWVAGQRLLADREHTTVDVAEVIAESREQARRLAPHLPLSKLLGD